LLEQRSLAGYGPKKSSLMGPWLELLLRPLGLIKQWGSAHDYIASQWVSRQRGDPEGDHRARFSMFLPPHIAGRRIQKHVESIGNNVASLDGRSEPAGKMTN